MRTPINGGATVRGRPAATRPNGMRANPARLRPRSSGGAARELWYSETGFTRHHAIPDCTRRRGTGLCSLGRFAGPETVQGISRDRIREFSSSARLEEYNRLDPRAAALSGHLRLSQQPLSHERWQPFPRLLDYGLSTLGPAPACGRSAANAH